LPGSSGAGPCWAHHGDDGILHGIAGPDGVIPHMKRWTGISRDSWGHLVGVGKADKAMQVSLLPLERGGWKIRGSPNRLPSSGHTGKYVAVVIDLQSDTHCDPPKIIAIIIILVVCGANGAPDA